MSLRDIPIPALPYVSVMLIEPILATREMFYAHIADSTSPMVAATMMRREQWRSRADAYAWLKCRAPWKRWDARVLRLLAVRPLLLTGPIFFLMRDPAGTRPARHARRRGGSQVR